MNNIYKSIENIQFLDPNINCALAATNDNTKDKIDLSLGTLCDINGKFYMFKSVNKAEHMVLNDINRTEKYLFMFGDDEFCLNARSLIFPGINHDELKHIMSIQTFGSTGGIFLFLQLFSNLGYNPTVYLSDPTWFNYYTILEKARLKYINHPYVKKDEHVLDIDSMIECLSKANFYDLLILQVNSHNPTGIDLSKDDWIRVLEVVQQRKLIVLFDIPYQGLSRDLEADVYPCSLFLRAQPPVDLYIAQSFSKIMGLCSGRIGCLHVSATSNHNNIRIALYKLIRAGYSNPPRHYSSTVKTVLNTPELRKEWLEELMSFTNGMAKMREKLTRRLVNELGEKWSFIGKQSGMFAYLDIDNELLEKLREHHVYMSLRGRIVLSRLNDNNIDRLIESLKLTRHIMFKRLLKQHHWKIIHDDLKYLFSQHNRDTLVEIKSYPWQRFASKEELLHRGLIPSILTNGKHERFTLLRDEIEKIAFDEPEGHLSNLFKGRLFHIDIDGTIERCIVSDVQCDPVAKKLYFIKFIRHIPGEISLVDIPCTIIGLLASPAYIKGCHVELSMHSIKCEVFGESIPPPFEIDVSKLDYTPPYTSIKLKDLECILPLDGKTLFDRHYTMEEEVVWAYLPNTIAEIPLPPDYRDPNFINRRGNTINLTFSGIIPKQ